MQDPGLAWTCLDFPRDGPPASAKQHRGSAHLDQPWYKDEPQDSSLDIAPVSSGTPEWFHMVPSPHGLQPCLMYVFSTFDLLTIVSLYLGPCLCSSSDCPFRLHRTVVELPTALHPVQPDTLVYLSILSLSSLSSRPSSLVAPHMPWSCPQHLCHVSLVQARSARTSVPLAFDPSLLSTPPRALVLSCCHGLLQFCSTLLQRSLQDLLRRLARTTLHQVVPPSLPWPSCDTSPAYYFASSLLALM